MLSAEYLTVSDLSGFTGDYWHTLSLGRSRSLALMLTWMTLDSFDALVDFPVGLPLVRNVLE